MVGGHCSSKSLPNIPTHLGGARRKWPLTGLPERAADFQSLTSDARSGHVSAPARPQPQSAASDQRPAISKHAPSGWLGYRELLQFSTMMIFLATTEAAATFSTMMVFVRCTEKVRHKVGHASEVARHARRSLFVLMGGARTKERLTSAPPRKDVTGARCWKRIACPVHR